VVATEKPKPFIPVNCPEGALTRLVQALIRHGVDQSPKSNTAATGVLFHALDRGVHNASLAACRIIDHHVHVASVSPEPSRHPARSSAAPPRGRMGAPLQLDVPSTRRYGQRRRHPVSDNEHLCHHGDSERFLRQTPVVARVALVLMDGVTRQRTHHRRSASRSLPFI
jgi:hypothetical protein